MPFVLVVDDDSAVRRMILLLLSLEGYKLKPRTMAQKLLR